MLNVHWLWAGACTSLMRLLNSHRHRLWTFHECLQELSDVDIRFNVNGHSIENGSIRLSYNIYEHSIMVTRVWLNGKETKELVDTIQQWLDNNQDYIK